MTGVLVTGATGNVGSEVCRHLSRAAVPAYAAVRAADGRSDPRLHGARPRQFDFLDKTTWQGAVADVASVFLVRPPHISRIKRDMAPFLRYLAEVKLKRLVFLSVQGAETNSIVPHHTVEQIILDLDIPAVFLRPSFFMQNLTTTHLEEIRDERRIFVPAGNGRTNFIDVRDIGEAAAAVLLDEGVSKRAYTLTGERSYTYYEVADRLSRILGTPITYEPARAAPFIRYQLSKDRTFGHALVMYALYSVTRMGKAGGETHDLSALIGRRPRSLDGFIADHRDILLGT